MTKFKYLIPKTIEEAMSLYLKNIKKNVYYMSGGTDLLLKIKKGFIKPDYVISLKHININDKIILDPKSGDLIINAFVTYRELKNSELINKKFKIIHDAIKNIGSVQIRNLATLGGNLVNAAPSADGAIPLIAMGALVELISLDGIRTVNLLDFFLGPGKTIIKPGEILLNIIIPKFDKLSSGAYKKVTRRASMELPLIGVGVFLYLKKRNSYICRKVRISLGVAAPKPIRAFKAENFLVGKILNEENLIKVSNLSSDESKVRDSIRGKAWHRKELIKVYVKRMILLSFDRINNI